MQAELRSDLKAVFLTNIIYQPEVLQIDASSFDQKPNQKLWETPCIITP